MSQTIFCVVPFLRRPGSYPIVIASSTEREREREGDEKQETHGNTSTSPILMSIPLIMLSVLTVIRRSIRVLWWLMLMEKRKRLKEIMEKSEHDLHQHRKGKMQTDWKRDIRSKNWKESYITFQRCIATFPLVQSSFYCIDFYFYFFSHFVRYFFCEGSGVARPHTEGIV